MDDTAVLLLNSALVVLFWVAALWLSLLRDSPNKLRQRIPIIPRYRKRRLHPLFKERTDVMWFALWPFLLGSVFFVLLIVNLVRR